MTAPSVAVSGSAALMSEWSRTRTAFLRLTRRMLAAVPLILILSVVTVLYGVNLNGYPEFSNDDEGTYFAQAWAVAHEGSMAHYTYWYDHPPMGWIQLAVLLQPLQWVWNQTGIPVETAGRGMMTLVAVVSAALIYKIGRNIGMPKLAALVAPLVWALAPVTINMGRQIFLDNISLVWLLASFALVTSKPKLQYQVVAGAAFGMAVLSKETAAVAMPAVLVSLWGYSWARTRAFSLVGFLGTATLLISGWVLFAIVKKELIPGPGHVSLWETVVWQLQGRGSAGFMFTDGSGANNILKGWLALDPYLIITGMLLSLVAVFYKPARGIALVPVMYLVVALRGGYIPGMYIITPLPFFALVIVYLAWKLWNAAGRPSRRTLSWAGRAAIVGLITASAIVVSPSWAEKSALALTSNNNEDYQEALAYVESNLPRNTTILTDGWSGPLWHFKLDRDPLARTKHLPGDWRDVDYIFSSRGMEVFVGGEILGQQSAPLAYAALSHSELVKAWGPVGQQIRLLKVNPDLPPVDPYWMRMHPDQAPTAHMSSER